MSNESSASETTPLRRPESQLSAAESSSTNVANNSNNNNNNVSSNNINPAQTELTFPTSTNNYNNFRIEERLNANNNNHSEPQQQQQQQCHKNNMDTNKRILCRVGLDILILLCGE